MGQAMGGGVVYIDWRVSGVPLYGIRRISFPLNIARAPHVSGYHFAQSFDFVDQLNGQVGHGYTGLQPRVNTGNDPMIRATFSTFMPGATTNDTLFCQPGANGGPGVSCAAYFSGTYDAWYYLEIIRTEYSTWTGTCVDAKSGGRIHIGTFTLPFPGQGIKPSGVGFLEHYPWNDGREHECSRLPWTEVTFGTPILTPFTPMVGSLGNPWQIGGCEGKMGYVSSLTSEGVRVEVGFNSSRRVGMDEVRNQYPYAIVQDDNASG